MLRTLTRKVMLLVVSYVVMSVLVALVVSIRIVDNHQMVSHLSAVTMRHIDLNGHFSNDLNRAVAEAASYARTRDPGDRDEAREALAAAHAHLDALAAMADQPDLMDDERSLSGNLDTRRTALLGGVERNIDLLLTGIEHGDDGAESAALDALNALEGETEAIHDTADEFLEASATAAVEAFTKVRSRGLVAVGIAVSLNLLATVASFVFVRRKMVRPLNQLAQAATAVAQGRFDQQIAVTSADEIGELQRAFNQMVADLSAQQATVEERGVEIQRTLEAQRRLFATIQELSTPLLPVWDGVVVLPLVGHIDTQRADAIMQTLLQGVSQRRARVAILDVTGVAILDTHVVKLLLQAIRAVELLGAQVLLAGITPTMAHVVVAQGIDLGGLRTYRDLRSAIEDALSSLVSAAL